VESDHDEAVALMRHVAANSKEAKARCKAARATIRKRFTASTVARDWGGFDHVCLRFTMNFVLMDSYGSDQPKRVRHMPLSLHFALLMVSTDTHFETQTAGCGSPIRFDFAEHCR
jgi:hypothetical protein